MRTFYTGNDIEDLVASGVRQLEVGAGVALTDTARERAEELGVALVIPGTASAKKAEVPTVSEKSGVLPSRPKGCQHAPLAAKIGRSEVAGGSATSSGATSSSATSGGGPVVDQLVEAVSALKKRGG
jgi:hypothetical protein